MKPKWIYCIWCGELAPQTELTYTCNSCGGKSLWTSHGTIPFIEELPITYDSALNNPSYVLPKKDTDEEKYQLRGCPGRIGIDCLKRKKYHNPSEPPQLC